MAGVANQGATKGSVMLVAVLAGSFGLAPGRTEAAFFTSTGWMPSSANLGLGPLSGEVRAEAMLSLPDMVTAMKESGFPVAAIAEIARVERKTVYSWLDGDATPRKQHQDRMWTLFTLLRKATDGHFRSIHRVWNAKGDDGTTLRDLLGAETLDEGAIRGRLVELARSIDRYTRRDLNPVPNPAVSDGNPALDSLPVADLL